LKDDDVRYEHLLKHFYKVPVEAIMKKSVWDLPILECRASIEEVFAILSSRRHVWIVESKDSMKLRGIITEKDLLDILLPKKLSPYTIGSINVRSILLGNIKRAEDVMNTKIVALKPTDTVETALVKMHQYRHRRLPVVDEQKKLVGEITLKTLIIQFRRVIKWHRITRKTR